MYVRRLLIYVIVLLVVASLTPLTPQVYTAICSGDQNDYTVIRSNVNTVLASILTQKRLFYEKNMYWLIYYDKSAGYVVYQTSGDGKSWSTTKYFCPGTDDFDVATNGTHIAYIRTGYFRLGSLNNDGTIAWCTASEVPTELTGDRQYWSICFDSFGYIWACFHYYYFEIRVVRNTKRDGTWTTASGYPLLIGYGLRSMVLPLLSGKIAVVFGKDGVAVDLPNIRYRLFIRVFNGTTWLQTVATSSACLREFSAVSFGDTIHVAFISSISSDGYRYEWNGITYAQYAYSSNSIVKENLVIEDPYGLGYVCGANRYDMVGLSVDKNNGDVYVLCVSKYADEDIIVKRYCASTGSWSPCFTWLKSTIKDDEVSLVNFGMYGCNGAICVHPYCYNGAVTIVFRVLKPLVYGFEHCEIAFAQMKPLLLGVSYPRHFLSNGRANITVYSSFIRGSYNHIDSIKLSIGDKVVLAWENGVFKKLYDPMNLCEFFVSESSYSVYDSFTIKVVFSFAVSGVLQESGNMPIKIMAHERSTGLTVELTKYARFKSFKACQIEPGTLYYDSLYLAYAFCSNMNMPFVWDGVGYQVMDETGIYLTGIFYDDKSVLRVIKMNKNYEIVWSKNYAVPNHYFLYCLASLLSKEHLYVVAEVSGEKVCVMKIDKRNGAVKWADLLRTPVTYDRWNFGPRFAVWRNKAYFALSLYDGILLMSYDTLNDNVNMRRLEFDYDCFVCSLDADETGVYVAFNVPYEYASFIAKMSHDFSEIYWVKKVDTGDSTLASIKAYKGKLFVATCLSAVYSTECFHIIELNANNGLLNNYKTLSIRNHGFDQLYFETWITETNIENGILYIGGFLCPEYNAFPVIAAINLTDYSQVFCKTVSWAFLENQFYHIDFNPEDFSYFVFCTSIYVDNELNDTYLLFDGGITVKINPSVNLSWVRDSNITLEEEWEVFVEDATSEFSISTPSILLERINGKAVSVENGEYETMFARLERRLVQPKNIPVFQGPITFNWSSPINHKAFKIQVSPTPNFEEIVYDKYVSKPFTNHTVDQYAMAVMLNRISLFTSTTTLYWRVILYDENGHPTNYDPLVFKYKKLLRVDVGIPLIPINISLEPPSLLTGIPSFESPSGIIMIGVLTALFLFISRRQRWTIALSITATVASIMGLLLFRNPYMFAISLVLVLLGILIDKYV